MSNVTVIPISMRIAQQSTELDFKSNPADEIIAATSVVEDIPLLTRDRNILRSKIVRFA
jgi:PIN domain nuclease of toxin-antitoxin system